MNSDTNKHGLTRDIPADVARAVRQRDGFGCVLCGSAVYTYEHVDPPFSEAKVHDPTCIALLCAGCHDRVTRGLLSKATVMSATQHPKCRETGFSFGPFDLGSMHPQIRIGPVTARSVKTVIRAVGDDIIKIEPPEAAGGPFRLTARLSNQAGTEIFRIDKNEWATPTSNWDVQVKGARITVHNAPGDVALVLRAEPPVAIVVERLDMFHKGARLTVREQTGLTVRSGSGSEITTTDMDVQGCEVAIDVQSDGSIGVGRGGSVRVGSMTSGSRHATRPRSLSPGDHDRPPLDLPVSGLAQRSVATIRAHVGAERSSSAAAAGEVAVGPA